MLITTTLHKLVIATDADQHYELWCASESLLEQIGDGFAKNPHIENVQLFNARRQITREWKPTPPLDDIIKPTRPKA